MTPPPPPCPSSFPPLPTPSRPRAPRTAEIMLSPLFPSPARASPLDQETSGCHPSPAAGLGWGGGANRPLFCLAWIFESERRTCLGDEGLPLEPVVADSPGDVECCGEMSIGFWFAGPAAGESRSEEHTSELQSHLNLVCRLLLEKKKKRQ